MRRLLTSAAVVALAAVPVAASAEDMEDSGLGHMAETMSDPANQQQMALMLQAMSEILLDMPLAPMMEAMAEATGEDPGKVDKDATLRSMAPGSSALPSQIAEQTPRMMRAMGGMAKGMEKMAPAMRAMAEKMKDAMPAMRE